jgi:serine/threonine protein kinase
MCWKWRDKGINVSADLGNILDKMLEELPNNRYQSAGDVLQAINQPKKVNAPIKSKVIVNVNYGNFQQLLAEGKWKEADRESDRLMLEIMFRTSFNDLSDVDLSNFPCEHLRKLDQLWVKYSGGKFGFSVQKNIWLKIGGKNDYETYKKLSEYLGWRKNGLRIINKEIIFDVHTAPVGNSPTFGRLWRLKLPFLLMRLQQCKI